MLLLTSVNDIVRVVTGQAVSTITVHCSYIDHNSGVFTPGNDEYNITDVNKRCAAILDFGSAINLTTGPFEFRFAGVDGNGTIGTLS